MTAKEMFEELGYKYSFDTFTLGGASHSYHIRKAWI